jgi:hypothetical protein
MYAAAQASIVAQVRPQSDDEIDIGQSGTSPMPRFALSTEIQRQAM